MSIPVGRPRRTASIVLALLASTLVGACDELATELIPAGKRPGRAATLECGPWTWNTDEDIGEQIEAVLEEAREESLDGIARDLTICLPEGQFFLSHETGIVLSEVEDVRLVGSGYYTVISLQPSVLVGLDLRGWIRDVQIADLRIVGSATESTYQVAVRSFPTATMDVEGLRIQGLAITAANQGMQIVADSDPYDATAPRPLDDVLIAQNAIWNMRGDSSGQGYGILTGDATNVRIVENHLQDIERHAIYVARGDGLVEIRGNFIENQRGGNALAVARSANVLVIANRFVNAGAHAISMEEDDTLSQPSTNLYVIGNEFLDADGVADLRVIPDATTVVMFWGNEHNGVVADAVSEAELDCWVRTGSTYDTNADCDAFIDDQISFTPSVWTNTQSIRPARRDLEDRRLYVMQANVLHAVDPIPLQSPNTWGYWYSSTNWSGFQAMSVMNDRIYVMQSGYLHEVNPSNWGYSYTYDASTFRALVAFEGYDRVFQVRGSRIEKILPATWAVVADSALNWSTATAMTRGGAKDSPLGGYIFVLRGSTIYRVNPNNLYGEPY